MLSWVSFSHVRSMHSYTDCRISFGSSSTHLEIRTEKNPTTNQIYSFLNCAAFRSCVGSFPLPFFGEALFDLHLMMAEELCCFWIKHLQREKRAQEKECRFSQATRHFSLHSSRESWRSMWSLQPCSRPPFWSFTRMLEGIPNSLLLLRFSPQ